MAYSTEPLPLVQFLQSNVKLPRFQRKVTWTEKQSFDLAISLFQNYPLGVIILNEEQKNIWLLDGRQRYTALQKMRDNPVELYMWAKSTLGFKDHDSEHKVVKRYWNKVDHYLEGSTDDSSTVSNFQDELDDVSESSMASQSEGTKTLLDIILMVHQKKWEKLFDFREYFNFLKYLTKDKSEIIPDKLRRFILELRDEVQRNGENECSLDFFTDYFLQNFSIKDGKEVCFKKKVAENWASIQDCINVVSRSEDVFFNAIISVIRLTNVSPEDARNIFSRINSGGTALDAEELRSARSFWNKPVAVEEIEQSVKQTVEKLYRKLEIRFSEPIVRWDIAATFISRIQDDGLLFNFHFDNEKITELITPSFKLLSAVFEKGVSKKSVDSLEKSNSISWLQNVDNLAQDLNTVCKLIGDDEFFNFFKAWKMPLISLIGVTPCLEFITILYEDWNEKNKPSKNSSPGKAFQRDARVLLEKLIYEYVIGFWSGSSDSKFSNHVKNWKKRLEMLDSKTWALFIEGLFEGKFGNDKSKIKILKPLLCYCTFPTFFKRRALIVSPNEETSLEFHWV